MIMHKKSDGTYEQIYFIKSKDGSNIDKILDADGNVYFTQGFMRTVSGVPPLALENSAGKPLVSYKIHGNSIQNGTPTPENPVEVQSAGDLVTDGEFSGKYRINVVTGSENQTPITTPIYLDEPLMSDEAITNEGVREVKWKKLVLTGHEDIFKNSSSINNYLYYISLSNVKLDGKNGLSTHLPQCDSPPIDNIGYNSSNKFSVLYLNFGADIINAQISGNTVKGVKEYLTSQYANGTPVTLWYQLAKPVTKSVILPKIPTFKGTTTILTDTEIQPSNMEITYKARK